MDLLARLTRAGVVGAGGAGFPTAKKIDCKAKYLLVNGAECEPLLETDRYLMRNRAADIINGVVAVKNHIGAEYAGIVLKKTYIAEIQSLQQAITANNAPIELHLMDSFYPAGDEQIMVCEALGKIVPPSGIPIQVETVVNNVCTMAWVSDAMNNRPVTSKLVTITGEVQNPCIVETPIGTRLGECLKAAGGCVASDVYVIVGGPMMGRYMSMEEAERQVVTKTTGGVIVVPAKSITVIKKHLSYEQIITRAKSVCIQCARCTEQCPRHLIGHPIHPHKLMRSVAYNKNMNLELLQEALLCSECGVCENYACPMDLSPRRINVLIKEALRKKGVRYQRVNSEIVESLYRSYRQLPTGRLTSRLGFSAYKVRNNKTLVPMSPTTVSIPLQQHIGSPAEPIVKEGERVVCGQTIASIAEGSLGADIHASISGIVTSIGDAVTIKQEVGVKND